ncbi:MAG TPA: anthranilate phosphoribosyltransferase [Bacteroidota bacterium]|nr:anthranilate phosphoribosyltransferase [Bacteroidota bacterium]
MKYFIEKCLNNEHLTTSEAADALDTIMSGNATDIQIAGLLIALRSKGETVDELVGFAKMMRSKAIPIAIEDPDAIDMCGTGGDGAGTFNISTVASFVVAGAGVTVAKHGNRAVSSHCGSADLLSSLGVKIDLEPEKVAESINKIGIGFLFAPKFHPAMKYAAKARTELGVKTIFNILGPITNPCGVKKQLIGTFNPEIAQKIAHALLPLGSDHACVVYNYDGVDEITLSNVTSVFEVKDGTREKVYKVSPETFGMRKQTLQHVKTSGKEENVKIAMSVLKNEPSSARDVVVANAAYGIYVSGKAKSVDNGIAMAQESLESGRAYQKLQQLIDFSNAA